MALEGHVDFYGYHADVEGWLFSGWSSTWPDDGEQRSVTGHFEEGDIHGEHLVTFFHRQDVGDRGLGFILFIKAARSDLNQFVSLEVASGDTVGQLTPMPRPPRLAPPDLIAALAPTLEDRARDGAGEVLRELVWQKAPVAQLGEAPSPVAYESGRPAAQTGKHRNGEAEPTKRGVAARVPAARRDQIDPKSLPSGFFNPGFYLSEYADVRTDREYGAAPFRHFIQNGLREGRQGSHAYDLHAMRALLEKRARTRLNGEDAVRMFLSLPPEEKFVPNNWFNSALFRNLYHNRIKNPECGDYELFLLYLAEAGRRAWSPNGLFDEAAYQANHPDIRSAITRGRISCGYEHFVTVGWVEGRAVAPMLVEDSVGSWPRSVRDFLLSPRTRDVDFLPWFADRFYRSVHADVHAVVRSGKFVSSLEHFLVDGLAEGRIPHPGLVHLARIGRFPADLAELTSMPGAPAQTVDLDDAAWLYKHILKKGWHPEPTRLNNLIWGMVTSPRISGFFDAAAYRSCNPDLDLPESDLDGARRHWERHGLDEGRIAPFSNVFAARTVDPERIFAVPQGINYIGPLSLETGMGYAARGYIDALRAGGVPVAEFDVSGIIHDGKPIDLFSPESLPYGHNLIHLNPDQVPHFVAKFGTDIMNGRMNIGFWAWELGAPRPEWRGILSGFDLILVPSQYARAAIAAFTNTPVLVIPHVVERNRLLAAARKAEVNTALEAIEAERSAGRKLILAVVDSSSYAKRKGVDVFIRIAQELGRREPGRYLFCLKTHSRDRSSLASDNMSGLMVIDELWGWSELCKLRSLADLYVSPHRSEGFGLNVFESIVMGVPTLASRSGGVTDILGDDYPLYIEGRAVQVGRDLGPYRKNALWFEPDIDQAIDKIREAVSPDFPRAEYERRTVGRIVRDLSVKAVGRQLTDTLRTHCGIGLDLTAFARTLLASRKQCFSIPELGDNGPQSSGAERDRALAAINPFFSIITPTFNTKPEWLRELYEDLLAQECPAWEWCIYDDGSTAPDTRAALRELKEADARVLVKFGAKNQGIVIATNNAVGLSSGVFVAFVDHDDRVAPGLLSSYRREIDRDQTIDVLYCDEDKLLPDGSYGDHYYKPDWSPEHLTSTMYVLHCLCARKELFLKLGGYRPETSGAQDHDFSLRAAVANARFHHVDKVLYHWRVAEGSAAAAPDAKPYTNEAGLRAVRNYLAEIGLPGTVEPGLLHGTYRIRPTITDPKVTLNILTAPSYGLIDGRRELYVDHFVASILKFDPGLDIVIRVIVNEGNERLISHMKKWDRRIKIESCPGSEQGFNFAKKANWAVRSSPTERVVLLNDDMEAIDDGWLPALIEMLEVPGVAVAGARLLYDDDSIQHAGIALGVNGASTHLFAGAPSDYIGYNAFTHVIRNYSAVTGACMAFTRSTFARLGGLDESFPVDFNDTDFCLKVIAAGLRIVYTPFAVLRHFESSSLTRLAADPVDTDAFCRRWRHYIDHDPHYNRNLTRSSVFCEAAAQ